MWIAGGAGTVEFSEKAIARAPPATTRWRGRSPPRETSSAAQCETTTPVAVDDVCAAPPPSGEPCGRYAGWTIWTCIDATTRAATDLGYKVTVVHDACAARDAEFDGVAVPAAQVHAAFMSGLSGTYATVVDCAGYLASR